jgi:cytochrome b
MNATNAHSGKPVLVWDAPVRVFHWLMVLSFAGAYITAESERFRLLHVTLGYTLAGLIVFRLLWGLVGTRHARFADFVRGPRAAWRYLTSLVGGSPQHHAGHNPAGALAIVALLVLGAVSAATGVATYEELGGEWLAELHEVAGNTMLAVVLVHVAGVVVGSVVHRENLVRAMVTGRKPVAPSEGITNAWRSVAVLMLVAVLGFWWLQWRSAPTVPLDGRPAASAKALDDGEQRAARRERRKRDHD